MKKIHTKNPEIHQDFFSLSCFPSYLPFAAPLTALFTPGFFHILLNFPFLLLWRCCIAAGFDGHCIFLAMTSGIFDFFSSDMVMCRFKYKYPILV
jgi:hypothetical protein